MLKDTQTLLTIGQFAKIHEINKKTLMWYDEIGLLKPAYIKENGYRYYTYQQSNQLETILMLKELNVSLKEIQEFMNHRCIESFDHLLDEKITEVNEKIVHYKSILKILENRKKEMQMLKEMQLDEITLIEKKAHYYLTVPTSSQATLEKEIECVIKQAQKLQIHRLHDASYGSILSVDNILKGNYEDYLLTIEIPCPPNKKGLHLQPAGTYLRAFCKGSWDLLPQKYEQIIQYTQKHHLIMQGFAYESGLNELVIDKMEDYITQIEIPVKIDKTK